MTEREGAATQVAPASSRTRRIPGEAGIWVFIFGDLVVFAYLFVAYLHYRSDNPDSFAAAQHHLNVDLGVVYTLLLLTSSLFAVLALRRIRGGRATAASRLVIATIGCGLAFVALKVTEYHSKVAAGITPGANQFYLFYYLLTGLHLVHVIIGLGVLTFLRWLARRATYLSALQLSLAEGCACFWHMVDVLWLAIFPLLYLVK
ncbi:cytochrome c oxidase subunit 3 [Mycolicibacterium sp. ELW1]|uniref:cytochrome c oxidase subunit 3 n=1 Tax=Mycolicibacterium sp. ELW1 TaxID=3434110 RepID=UPI003D788220